MGHLFGLIVVRNVIYPKKKGGGRYPNLCCKPNTVNSDSDSYFDVFIMFCCFRK